MLKGAKHCRNWNDSSFIKCAHHAGSILVTKSFLVISEILRPLFNLLTQDDKYCLGDRENLLEPIEMQLSKNRQIFSDAFTAFLKSTFDYEHFEKKDDSHSLCISEIIHRGRCGT